MRNPRQVNDELNEMTHSGRILENSQTDKEIDMYTHNSRSRKLSSCATAVALLLLLALPASTPAENPEKSLYDRLGGYNAVSAVVDDFAAKLFDDPEVGKFFVGMGTDTRESFRQKNKNLVCNVTGGPCKIISRSAKVTHAGLGITESDFDVVAGHLGDTLNKFNVPEKEQQELFAIISTLKPDIVDSTLKPDIVD